MFPCPLGPLGRFKPKKTQQVIEIIGRGSWIRTNDLQYPKLPRYQAALYPDLCWECVDTRLNRGHQGDLKGSALVEERVRHPVAGLNSILLRRAGDHFEHTLGETA
jgi:hypothetical protein